MGVDRSMLLLHADVLSVAMGFGVKFVFLLLHCFSVNSIL